MKNILTRFIIYSYLTKKGGVDDVNLFNAQWGMELCERSGIIVDTKEQVFYNESNNSYTKGGGLRWIPHTQAVQAQQKIENASNKLIIIFILIIY